MRAYPKASTFEDKIEKKHVYCISEQYDRYLVTLINRLEVWKKKFSRREKKIAVQFRKDR